MKPVLALKIYAQQLFNHETCKDALNKFVTIDKRLEDLD